MRGRRKPHHTHEVNDAYADGWDAYLRWFEHPNQPKPINPYGLTSEVQLRKQSDDRRAVHDRDVDQWQRGWEDCELDLNVDDLDEVTPADFDGAPLVIPDDPVQADVDEDDGED